MLLLGVTADGLVVAGGIALHSRSSSQIAELLGSPGLLEPARIAFSVAKGGIEFHRFLAPLLSLSAVAIRR